jgi:hypothetical protein
MRHPQNRKHNKKKPKKEAEQNTHSKPPLKLTPFKILCHIWHTPPKEPVIALTNSGASKTDLSNTSIMRSRAYRDISINLTAVVTGKISACINSQPAPLG